MSINTREELIQVAAVAVAVVADNDGASEVEYPEEPFEDVAVERLRQLQKWGPQTHSDVEWFAILMEEVGEVAESIIADPSPFVNHKGSRAMRDIVSAAARLGQRARSALETYDWPEQLWVDIHESEALTRKTLPVGPHFPRARYVEVDEDAKTFTLETEREADARPAELSEERQYPGYDPRVWASPAVGAAARGIDSVAVFDADGELVYYQKATESESSFTLIPPMADDSPPERGDA